MRLDSISDASSPNQTKFTAEGLGLGLWAYLGGTSKGIMAIHGTVVPKISHQGLGAPTPTMDGERRQHGRRPVLARGDTRERRTSGLNLTTQEEEIDKSRGKCAQSHVK